jgi:biopolymer transport protein ExbD
MRAPSLIRREGLGFNMTPMIDVVFLLIVFFLVSSNLVQQETQMEIDLPTATTGKLPREEKARNLIINIPREGEIFVGARPMEEAKLRKLLVFERGRAAESLEIRIRTSRQVPYRAIEPVLVACAESGVWNVSFSVVHH